MGKNRHTPEDWYYSPPDRGDSSVGIGPVAGAVYACSTAGGDPDIIICTLHEPCYRVDPDPADEYDDGLRGTGTEEGNGLLIAASPALLAAAKELKAAFLDGCGQAVHGPKRERLVRAVAALDAAIAKAEG